MAVWPSTVSPCARPSPSWKSSPGFTTSASSNKFGVRRLNHPNRERISGFDSPHFRKQQTIFDADDVLAFEEAIYGRSDFQDALEIRRGRGDDPFACVDESGRSL